MQDFLSLFTQTKPNMPFHWPGVLSIGSLLPLPRKLRLGGRSRLRQRSKRQRAGVEDVTALKTSFNIVNSIKALQRHRWTVFDAQYAVLFAFILFSLYIAPSAPLVKTGALVGVAILLLMPITRQFFLPSLSIWTYLLYFFTSRYIPTEYRPHIWVKVLPALENVLYGANLSNLLSAHTYAVLDLLAWFPYGIGHFAAPAICSAVLFVFAAPGTTPVFARTFGWLGVLGVTIQLILPCTPPWYEKVNGLEPAYYGMAGSPAGLARIDALFGIDMYTTSFSTAPVPFGAFPSLHAANAVLEALFMDHCFPRFRGLFILYVGWIWWATMYLNHHYAVDLVGGSIISAVMFYVARARYIPRQQPDKRNRWQYEYVEIGERPRTEDEEYGYGKVESFGLGLLDQRRNSNDSDEWTLGSRSSFGSASAGSRSGAESGSLSSSSSSPGSLSPATVDGGFRPVVLGLTPQGSVWHGDGPARDSELHEVVVMR